MQLVLVALWRWSERVDPSGSNHWYAQLTWLNSGTAVYSAPQLFKHTEEKRLIGCSHFLPLLLQHGITASYFEQRLRN